MKKLIFSLYILVLTTLSLSAAVDEYKIDLYYANGMMGNSLDAEQKAWNDYVDDLKSSSPAESVK